MIAVLDTSAAVEVVLKRKSSALFNDFLAEADLVIAPTLLITEATNVFWKYQKFSDFPYDKCCLLYTSPSPRDVEESRMPSSA